MRHLLLVLGAIAICSCNHPKKMHEHKPVFDLEGHRGCRGLMPENIIPAFLKAMELGVTTLEMDVVITIDKQVLVSHEPFFNHEISTKPDGQEVKASEELTLNIYKMSFAETQQFDVGLKPHPRFPEQQKMAAHKPLLREVFDSVQAWCQAHGKATPRFNIEIKSLPVGDNIYHPEPKPFTDLVIAVIHSAGLEKQVILQSFDFRVLQYLHTSYPSITAAALIEDYDKLPFEKQLEKLGFVPNIYSPAKELVTPELVKTCHDKGIKLVPWTVNDVADMQELRSWGVDGLITDYPNLFKF